MRCNCCGNVLWLEQTENGATLMVKKCDADRTETGFDVGQDDIKLLIVSLQKCVKESVTKP